MMKDKAVRLVKALRYETLKRLPFVVALLIILGLAGAIQSYHKTSEGVRIARNNSVDTKQVLQQVAKLSVDNKNLIEQNKELTQQNLQLAQENAMHIDCIANLFAQWTRTGNAIDGQELSTCIIVTLSPSKTSSANKHSSTPSQKSSGNSPSHKNAPKVNTPQSNKSRPNSIKPTAPTVTPPTTSTPHCKINILFIHIMCK